MVRWRRSSGRSVTGWEWGVRALMRKGNDLAVGVGLSAGAFAEQEQYVKDSFKIGVNSLNGNPHLSENEVKAMRWDTIRDQSAYDNPDFSGESALKAKEEVGQAWRQTGHELGFGSSDSAEDSGLLGRAAEQIRKQSGASQAPAGQAEQLRTGSGQGD
ncbi:hypothetical protein [Streptomyces sp. MMS24-I29]|uniref:hypothetical protein n=1 Tax=Streptomyces sp. MMS24-I29 TaxID=3351480 RepID=UPI003C7B4A6E